MQEQEVTVEEEEENCGPLPISKLEVELCIIAKK